MADSIAAEEMETPAIAARAIRIDAVRVPERINRSFVMEANLSTKVRRPPGIPPVSL